MISLLLWDIYIPVFSYINFILLRFERNEKCFSKSYYFLLQSYGMKHCNARARVLSSSSSTRNLSSRRRVASLNAFSRDKGIASAVGESAA